MRHRVLADPVGVCQWQVDVHTSWQAHLVLADHQFADDVMLLLQVARWVLAGLQRLQDLAWEELRVHLHVVHDCAVLSGEIVQDGPVMRSLQHLLLLLGCSLFLGHLVQKVLLSLLQLAVAHLLVVLLKQLLVPVAHLLPVELLGQTVKHLERLVVLWKALQLVDQLLLLTVCEVHQRRVALVKERALHCPELVEQSRLFALRRDGVGHCGHLHIAHRLVHDCTRNTH